MRSPELTDPGEPKCGQWSRVSDAVTITLVTLIITVERANGFINILFFSLQAGTLQAHCDVACTSLRMHWKNVGVSETLSSVLEITDLSEPRPLVLRQ